ncbi:MAG: hypothetical protein AB1489_25975 [Acidobacteriota bacterium]
MLCIYCKITFAFYLNYCRYCGSRLQEEPRPATAETMLLASKVHLDTQEPSPYVTARLTKQIGTPQVKLTEVAQHVLNSFPSIDTVPIPENYIATISRARNATTQTQLREFSLAEFTALEGSSDTSVNDLITLEGNSTPLNSGNFVTVSPTLPLMTSCELRQVRARLHLKPAMSEQTGSLTTRRWQEVGRDCWQFAQKSLRATCRLLLDLVCE